MKPDTEHGNVKHLETLELTKSSRVFLSEKGNDVRKNICVESANIPARGIFKMAAFDDRRQRNKSSMLPSLGIISRIEGRRIINTEFPG